jgi:hypothetical protein
VEVFEAFSVEEHCIGLQFKGCGLYGRGLLC